MLFRSDGTPNPNGRTLHALVQRRDEDDATKWDMVMTEEGDRPQPWHFPRTGAC